MLAMTLLSLLQVRESYESVPRFIFSVCSPRFVRCSAGTTAGALWSNFVFH
jgi:hypothetical protein